METEPLREVIWPASHIWLVEELSKPGEPGPRDWAPDLPLGKPTYLGFIMMSCFAYLLRWWKWESKERWGLGLWTSVCWVGSHCLPVTTCGQKRIETFCLQEPLSLVSVWTITVLTDDILVSWLHVFFIFCKCFCFYRNSNRRINSWSKLWINYEISSGI